MTNIYTDIELLTESDVEQKFVLKILTSSFPVGLGYSDADFRTKTDIRKLSIDKGLNRKIYYPDYAVIIDGFPVIVIEAKAPNEDMEEAYRQARLYASEINAMYKSNINPCSRIMVTDGFKVMAGYWDHDTPKVTFLSKDMIVLNPQFNEFLVLMCKNEVSRVVQDTLRSIRKQARFFKPVHMLGGQAVINETVGENSFGANVSLEYKYLFNPDTLEDREQIVKNAYIRSKRKESHIAPIDKIIRAALPVSLLNSKPIEDTSNPNDLLERLSDTQKIRNEICLLIGSVGSGKSTFIDYLRIVGLPDSLRDSTEWISINLNLAPLSKDLIYKWVLSNIIEGVKNKHIDIDFDHIQTLRKVYSREIAKLDKGRLSLYPKDSEKYIDVMYQELERLQSDDFQTLDGLINFLYSGRNKLPVIVLDNCDKRQRDDQLLMFQVAAWLRNSFPCMVFLPLRDSTYDQYCDEPPLDTVVKDLVFRIDPPLLERVIHARLNYALREISNNNTKFSYYLPNNARVECDRSEVAAYLKCIVSSLFQDNFFKRIIVGLAGRNIRKGIEILLDFVKSGHIGTDDIFKIRQAEGDYQLPSYIVSRILLKGKRKYYSDSHSNIKSVFFSEAEDLLPDPFVRISILRWLKNRVREFGPNRTKGYHKVGLLIKSLQSAGHSRKRVLSEIEALARANCISTEAQDGVLSEDDLISISPGGFVHLDLVKDINYLQAISEDVFFRENQVAKAIADNIVGRGTFRHQSRQASISCSSLLVDYLAAYYEDYFVGDAAVLTDESKEDLIDIASLKDYVDTVAQRDPTYVSVINMETEYPLGSEVEAQIVSVQPYGFFVEFGLHGNGFIHKKDFNGRGHDILQTHESGDWLIGEIIGYNQERNRFNMRLIDI